DMVITSAPSEVEQALLKSESVAGSDTLEEARDWRLAKAWISPARRGSYFAEAQMRLAAKEDWKLSPLRIPDRDLQRWESTHPLAQIQWTQEKNAACGGHYLSVVRSVKWWRRFHLGHLKYPKGYPLEHLVGACCPDGITSVAEG